MMASTTGKMPLIILLIGKTGHGKSATGNSILGRRAFKTSSGGKAETKIVSVAWGEYGSYEIKVVDGPGFEDADLDAVQNKERACENMAKALAMCNGGVHAFVLVIKFGGRFTPEERKVISDLRQIFGDSYLQERGIIVVTGGDQFADKMEEEETPEKTFTGWCLEQNEAFGNIFQECSHRVVMFNNTLKCAEEEKNKTEKRVATSCGRTSTQHWSIYD